MNEITTFIVSCENNPNFQDCVAAIKNQSIKSNIEIIKDYHPMSLAFQQMLLRCKTKYYVEVDEDMILNSNALEILYNEILKSEEKIAMVACKLHDPHVIYDIYGVKIYKFDIFKNYPYNLECLSCEIEQMDRIKKDGYTIELSPSVVGVHSPKWNDEDIFERYYDLMEKFKKHRYGWLEDLLIRLWSNIKKNPSETNLYALLGAYTSVIREDIKEKEKDYTKKPIEFYIAKSYLNMPITATLYCSSNCNFKCDGCYRNNIGVEPTPDVSIWTIREMLLKFPTIKSICVCGYGETFMNPNLKDLIVELKSKGIFIGLITNGSLISEKFKTNFVSQNELPNYISISLNASNPNNHKQRTGTGTYYQVIDGIKLCLAKKIETYVSYICSHETLKDIPEFLRVVYSLGVRTVHLHNLLPHFDNEEKFWSLVLQKKDEQLINDLKKLPESSIIKRYPILIDRNETPHHCQFPWNSISVDGNGNIGICNSVHPCHAENGNVRYACWHTEKLDAWRKNLHLNQNLSCLKCFRNWE